MSDDTDSKPAFMIDGWGTILAKAADEERYVPVTNEKAADLMNNFAWALELYMTISSTLFYAQAKGHTDLVRECLVQLKRVTDKLTDSTGNTDSTEE